MSGMPGKTKSANEHRTNCKICRLGIYTNEAAEWGRGQYLGMVHADCARRAGVQTQPLPLSSGVAAAGDGQRVAAASSGLTVRQAEILQLRSDGLAPAAIADRLGISAMTVHNNLRNARMRLGVDTIDDLIALVRRRGIVAHGNRT
jgi:DNA-binding CsgD family transcriptional regulator